MDLLQFYKAQVPFLADILKHYPLKEQDNLAKYIAVIGLDSVINSENMKIWKAGQNTGTFPSRFLDLAKTLASNQIDSSMYSDFQEGKVEDPRKCINISPSPTNKSRNQKESLSERINSPNFKQNGRRDPEYHKSHSNHSVQENSNSTRQQLESEIKLLNKRLDHLNHQIVLNSSPQQQQNTFLAKQNHVWPSTDQENKKAAFPQSPDSKKRQRRRQFQSPSSRKEVTAKITSSPAPDLEIVLKEKYLTSQNQKNRHLDDRQMKQALQIGGGSSSTSFSSQKNKNQRTYNQGGSARERVAVMPCQKVNNNNFKRTRSPNLSNQNLLVVQQQQLFNSDAFPLKNGTPYHLPKQSSSNSLAQLNQQNLQNLGTQNNSYQPKNKHSNQQVQQGYNSQYPINNTTLLSPIPQTSPHFDSIQNSGSYPQNLGYYSSPQSYSIPNSYQQTPVVFGSLSNQDEELYQPSNSLQDQIGGYYYPNQPFSNREREVQSSKQQQNYYNPEPREIIDEQRGDSFGAVRCNQPHGQQSIPKRHKFNQQSLKRVNNQEYSQHPQNTKSNLKENIKDGKEKIRTSSESGFFGNPSNHKNESSQLFNGQNQRIPSQYQSSHKSLHQNNSSFPDQWASLPKYSNDTSMKFQNSQNYMKSPGNEHSQSYRLGSPTQDRNSNSHHQGAGSQLQNSGQFFPEYLSSQKRQQFGSFYNNPQMLPLQEGQSSKHLGSTESYPNEIVQYRSMDSNGNQSQHEQYANQIYPPQHIQQQLNLQQSKQQRGSMQRDQNAYQQQQQYPKIIHSPELAYNNNNNMGTFNENLFESRVFNSQEQPQMIYNSNAQFPPQNPFLSQANLNQQLRNYQLTGKLSNIIQQNGVNEIANSFLSSPLAKHLTSEQNPFLNYNSMGGSPNTNQLKYSYIKQENLQESKQLQNLQPQAHYQAYNSQQNPYHQFDSKNNLSDKFVNNNFQNNVLSSNNDQVLQPEKNSTSLVKSTQQSQTSSQQVQKGLFKSNGSGSQKSSSLQAPNTISGAPLTISKTIDVQSSPVQQIDENEEGIFIISSPSFMNAGNPNSNRPFMNTNLLSSSSSEQLQQVGPQISSNKKKQELNPLPSQQMNHQVKEYSSSQDENKEMGKKYAGRNQINYQHGNDQNLIRVQEGFVKGKGDNYNIISHQDQDNNNDIDGENAEYPNSNHLNNQYPQEQDHQESQYDSNEVEEGYNEEGRDDQRNFNRQQEEMSNDLEGNEQDYPNGEQENEEDQQEENEQEEDEEEQEEFDEKEEQEEEEFNENDEEQEEEFNENDEEFEEDRFQSNGKQFGNDENIYNLQNQSEGEQYDQEDYQENEIGDQENNGYLENLEVNEEFLDSKVSFGQKSEKQKKKRVP